MKTTRSSRPSPSTSATARPAPSFCHENHPGDRHPGRPLSHRDLVVCAEAHPIGSRVGAIGHLIHREHDHVRPTVPVDIDDRGTAAGVLPAEPARHGSEISVQGHANRRRRSLLGNRCQPRATPLSAYSLQETALSVLIHGRRRPGPQIPLPPTSNALRALARRGRSADPAARELRPPVVRPAAWRSSRPPIGGRPSHPADRRAGGVRHRLHLGRVTSRPPSRRTQNPRSRQCPQPRAPPR